MVFLRGVTESAMKLISIPANPVPEGVATGALKTPDGVSIRYARWEPPSGRKGTVCIFQGRTEFIEKYFELVRDLRARGFAVATLDWRGQGLSERRLRDSRKGHVRSFREYDIDLETFVQEIVLPDCPPPFFALGHSMGAAVLMRAAAHGHRWFDRMVLTAPLIRLINIPMLSLAPALVRTLRLVGLGGSYVPGGGPHESVDPAVRQQPRDLRSGPPRPHGRRPGGGAGADDRRADQRLDGLGVPGDGAIRQSGLRAPRCASPCCWWHAAATSWSRPRRSRISPAGCGSAPTSCCRGRSTKS